MSNNISSKVLFKVALTVNLVSAIWNIISDCDETYNYWEPLHFIIYGKGFQSWEYCPTYALRSYLYLIIFGWPAIVLNLIFNDISKRILFYVVRAYMVMLTTCLEVHIYKSLKTLKSNKSSYIAIYCMLLLILSAGSFISSTAFLPSSFAFYCSILTFSSWIRKDYGLTIGSVAMSSILGWPFSALLGVPFAIDIIWNRRKFVYFLKISAFWGVLLSTISILVDSFFYGRLTFPAWNIFKYNVLTPHGPDLYGIEPVTFYLKNYFLNFNFAVFLVPIFPILLIYSNFFRQPISDDLSLGLMGFAVFILWNIVFFFQSHKEERFLFPCYPCLSIICGVCINQFQVIINDFLKIFKKAKSTLKWISKDWFGMGFVFIFSLLSMSRILALVLSYSAPISLYSHLNDVTNGTEKLLCLGREWHRFPSNFFIAKYSMNVSFIKSDFQGQLPAHFRSSEGVLSSRVVHRHFNDLNREEIGRYVPVSTCDFIIDRIDNVESINEPNWEKLNSGKWRKIMNYSMLSPHKFGKGFSFIRSFYIPFLFENQNHFIDYAVFEKTNFQ